MLGQYNNGVLTELVGNILFSPSVYQPAETLSPEQRTQFNVYEILDKVPEVPAGYVLAESWSFAIKGAVIERTWSLLPMTPEQLQAQNESTMSAIIQGTQQRLDTFAKSRNYDSILSACTYATSAVVKFKNEGQYCVNSRDSTWSVLYGILAAVQAGTRQMPKSYAEIEPELPNLTWP